MLQKAIDFATKALEGKKDHGGQPMIAHALRMMDRVNTEEEKIIAVLHDVVEEGGCSFHELKEAGFGQTVLEGVDVLTRRPNMKYFDYIDDISTNPMAARVKLAEMAENKDQDRVNKLSFQTYTLEERLARVKKMLEDT
ncbi:MAG: HD domain-containing protein [Hungatella sp.]|jgi:(p)ppGpp synthase/HD superfamily hydrolase|nr:HD domain-containing protein [Hungatella sp.]MCI9502623.1 HD domain-containing protein [Hungatella sp.]MCI9637051.1 HD domain-containing protein [Hungatella sp.]